MKRVALAMLAVIAAAAPARLIAQDAQQSYKEKREQLVRELQDVQKQLTEVRGERVQLQARIESVVAQMLQQRTQTLLLSNETNALQQLDAILTASQDNLLAQRDRFSTIGDAVKRRTGAVLVVLLRADSSQSQTLGEATLQVDGAVADTRSYSATANNALGLGAVDQLYRAQVLPTGHTVSLQVTVNGQPMTQQISVNAAGESVTYVQFAVRNGQLIPTTWTSRGTTPF